MVWFLVADATYSTGSEFVVYGGEVTGIALLTGSTWAGARAAPQGHERR
jgi:hypothetical protein